ncbi:MBL fold metallo-hydrolase [Sulfitobacter sp. D7]|uniref:MBL fold metallo-hydrolase n=1 Tax=Sulfitobacter sp. D7 TaxID=1968541 RepID=UPI000E774649|nr:MBL fold metallo-hydrolase [Sulfitobacter sp. D7]AYE88303.1 hypothetical protein B5M07_18990 [Sulfitobacter sp. D7]
MFTFGKRHWLYALAMFLAVSACSHGFAAFWNDKAHRLPVAHSLTSTTQVRFFGVSSFLIRSGNSSLMIDGFLSRPPNALTRKVQPELSTVTSLLATAGVPVARSCENSEGNGKSIDAVVAMHGHYDHALDTPLIAALTGATFIANREVLSASSRMARLFPDLCAITDFIEITGSGPIRISLGDIKLTLFETPHSTNPASTLLERLPADDAWEFPTSIRDFKSGISLAAHIETPDGAILILPTAGNIGPRLRNLNLEANTIFLGVGGLGWQSSKKIKRYILNSVVASRATKVIPIHWDAHAPAIDPSAPSLPIPAYENLNRALQALAELSKDNPDISILSIPTLNPFDPFLDPTTAKPN